MRARILDLAVRLLIASACVPIVVGGAAAEIYVTIERRRRAYSRV